MVLGKTSMCETLAEKMDNTIFLDLGEIARAAIMACKKNLFGIISLGKIILGNKQDIDGVKLLKKLKISIKIVDKKTEIYINGKKQENKKTHTLKNSVGVSKYVQKFNKENLYKFVRTIIDDYKIHSNVIVSGRDLLKIYPNLDYHIYITCDLNERVERRYNQYNKKYSKEKIKENIIKRDKYHEEAGYNNLDKRTIKLDLTDCKNAEESAKKVYDKIFK